MQKGARTVTTFRLHRGDALDVLRGFPDNSVDSIVCDPPYGLRFMGRHWDYDLPIVDTWRECFRVLKPGGHLLAFAGTRTQHRMAVRIEDAGFEIRDMIAWMYGSGFPKSLDVSKAIDKAAGAVHEVVGKRTDGRYAHGFSEQAKKALGGVVASESATGFSGEMGVITAPATPDAAKWQGWGTALKPALEPITVARKPLDQKTVAANVLAHGTGAINIDACRVPLTGAADAAEFENNHRVTERLPQSYDGEPLGLHDGGWKQRVGDAVIPEGRWPANVIHDGSDEVVSAFPANAGAAAPVKGNEASSVHKNAYGERERVAGTFFGDAGSAARFFYAAKASRKDRGEGNNHPTVKPTDLMRYLCRLVTPAGGVVLDPFVGSGSTGKAAVLEGFQFIGIDRDADENGEPLGYLDIARARIKHAGGIEMVLNPGEVTLNWNVPLDRLNSAVDDLISALRGIGAAVKSTNSTHVTTEDDEL